MNVKGKSSAITRVSVEEGQSWFSREQEEEVVAMNPSTRSATLGLQPSSSTLA
jgi:hypothetical protein